MSTNLQFSGGPRTNNTTTVGASEFTGTTYTVGAAAEGDVTEAERHDQNAAIQEVEIGGSHSNRYNGRSDV